MSLVLYFLLITIGDRNVRTSQVLEAVFMTSGDNPCKLVKNTIKYVLFQFFFPPLEWVNAITWFGFDSLIKLRLLITIEGNKSML